ncbi:hypothetical protein [Halorussus salinus]|uniref:hypothetical protein n=1 Tax=Halorussus salinus TaxID=1364935 RepID=UPI001092E978|nr:hypothetical protein [Halorussus salinus]
MQRKVPTVLTLLVIVWGLVEYVLFTRFAVSVVRLFGGLLDIFAVGAESLPEPQAARATSAGWLEVFGHFSHALILLPIVFVLWVYAIQRWQLTGMRLAVLSGLGAILGVVGVSFPGFFSSVAPQPSRFYLFATIPIAAFLGGCSVLGHKSDNWRRGVTAGLVVVLLFQSMAFSASISPPGEPRYFLTGEEVAGKHFASEHLESPVYTDQYYAREVVFPQSVKSTTHPAVHLGGDIAIPPFKQTAGHLFNGTLSELETVALRTDESVFRPSAGTVGGGYQELTYDPEVYLDETHSKVYSNGGVNVYTNESDSG